MNICLTTDKNYVGLLKVVVLSIIENNKDTDSIIFHILENGITNIHKAQIERIISAGHREVRFYCIDDVVKKMEKNISNDWADRNSYVTYARLFMPEIISRDVKKIIYLDCDTLVIGSLKKIFEENLDGACIAAVRDVLPYQYKVIKGLAQSEYCNAGVLVIDVIAWNSLNCTKRIINYCIEHGNDAFPDQDAINVILKEKIKILNPEYCVFYPEYSWPAKIQIKGYGNKEHYYKEEQLEYARHNPIIIHYVDSVLGRPWQTNNINPLSNIWFKYYFLLPQDERFICKKKHISRNQKVFRIMYKILPDILFSRIYYWRRNSGLMKRLRKLELSR